MTVVLDPDRVRAHHFHAHGLVQPVPGLPALFDQLVALHHTDPATARLSALARMPHTHVDDVHSALDHALTEARTAVRVIAMRGTLFAVSTEELPWFDAATREGLRKANDRQLARLLVQARVCEEHEVPATVARLTAQLVEVLADRSMSAAELAEHVGALQAVWEPLPTDNWGKPFPIGGRLLNGLAISGGILRGPPKGSWRSAQFEWVGQDAWLGGPLPEVGAAEGMAHVIRRYLGAFGPVTLDDVVWWTGWTKTACRKALKTIAPVSVTVRGWEGERLAQATSLDALQATAPLPPHHVALLPALDPYPMGTKDRGSWLDPAFAKELFDYSGNVGPTVWLGGRMVGGWAHQASGDVAWEPVVPVDSAGRSAIEAAVSQLGSTLGPDQVRFRFPAPIEKRLR